MGKGFLVSCFGGFKGGNFRGGSESVSRLFSLICAMSVLSCRQRGQFMRCTIRRTFVFLCVCVCFFFSFFIKIQSGLELGYILSRAPVAQWYNHHSSPSWISLYFFQCHILREFSYSSVFPSQKSPVVFPLVCNSTLPAHIVFPAVVLRRVTHQATKQYTDYSTTSSKKKKNYHSLIETRPGAVV